MIAESSAYPDLPEAPPEPARSAPARGWGNASRLSSLQARLRHPARTSVPTSFHVPAGLFNHKCRCGPSVRPIQWRAGTPAATIIPDSAFRRQEAGQLLGREANAANNELLSFLFHRQILEVDGGDPVGFINKTLRRHRSSFNLSREDLANLLLAGRSLGNYLLDDCRHAIAHIKRKPGKKRIDVDQ
jgi:hypothetical protein